MRVSEDFTQHMARLPMRGCSLPLILRIQPLCIFPGFPSQSGSPDPAWFPVVEPRVFHAFTAGPDVFTGTEQVWQPMHLSRFSTMPTCEEFSFYALLYLVIAFAI